MISWASPRRHPCVNAARPPAQLTRAPPRNLMPPPVPRAGGRLLSSRTTAAPTSQPTGLVGKEQGKRGLSAAAAPVITALFYLWPPGIHTASPLLVLLYHHPQFCLSAGSGREVPLQQGGAKQRKRRHVSLGPEGGGRGDREPAAPTGAVDRQGLGRGFLGPRCRPWEPPRPVLLEVDKGRATLSAGALGGRVVLSDSLGPESEGTGACRRQGMDAGSLATDANNGRSAVRRSSEIQSWLAQP